MNFRLLGLVADLYVLIKDGKYYEAIELNKEITKILNTYKDCC